MSDQPMFEVPDRYRAPDNSKPDKLTVGTYRGKRETCGLCAIDIKDGILKTPLATATRTATQWGRKWLLCRSHCSEVKGGSRKLPR